MERGASLETQPRCVQWEQEGSRDQHPSFAFDHTSIIAYAKLHTPTVHMILLFHFALNNVFPTLFIIAGVSKWPGLPCLSHRTPLVV